MAKKSESNNQEQPKKPNALSFMKALSKETGSEAFSESKLTEVDHYISTGNFALNRIISGSIYKGLPCGILSVFCGDSASMKTVLAFRMAANAIKENNYDCIIYIDSEGGANRGMLENAGIDPSLVQYIPVSNIEECTIKLLQTYKTIGKYQKETDPDFKCLIILDSLGGLVSEKVLMDAENDKTAGDLGGAAKKCLDPETLVWRGDCTLASLKDLKVGDEVLTHSHVKKKVTDVFRTKHPCYYKFKIGSNVIKCSKDHRFLISRDGNNCYVEAQQITTDDRFIRVRANRKNPFDQYVKTINEGLRIESIEKIDEEIELIDITVEDHHTFLITEDKIVSHNCSSMLRAATMPALKTKCGMIIISQTYDNPGALFKSKIMNIRGGKSVFYQPSLVVQLSRRLEKGQNKEDNFYEDAVITAFTIKTRQSVRPFLETELKLSFKNGFSGYEYYGLIPEAIRLGFIDNSKTGWYVIPSYSDKQFRLKDIIGGPEAKKIWDSFIAEFDKKSQDEISYKSLSNISLAETEKQFQDELKAKFNQPFEEGEV